MALKNAGGRASSNVFVKEFFICNSIRAMFHLEIIYYYYFYYDYYYNLKRWLISFVLSIVVVKSKDQND